MANEDEFVKHVKQTGSIFLALWLLTGCAAKKPAHTSSTPFTRCERVIRVNEGPGSARFICATAEGRLYTVDFTLMDGGGQ